MLGGSADAKGLAAMNIPTRPPNAFVPASGVGPHFGVGGGSGMFPHSWDGGIPPNAATPNNPAQAFIHDPFPPTDTSALYYGNGCDVRLRPHVLNSLISELASTVERGEVAYRASRLTNLELATRYLIQRGIPRGQLFVEQNPWHFDVTLDPPATRYNDFMTLTLVPKFIDADTTQNRGYVRMNVNGLGYRPLLRNDGYELRAGDLLPGKPFAAAYFDPNWYHIGLVASQVPLVMVGAIDFWIRPDGNDETGDGTANRADKAFRTISGCWYAVGSRYAGSPSAHIAMRLGIPGNYESGAVGPFGASVSITGDVFNRTGYRILSNDTYPGQYGTFCLSVVGVNTFLLRGVELAYTDQTARAGLSHLLSLNGTNATLDRVQLSLHSSANAPRNSLVRCWWGSKCFNSNTYEDGANDVRAEGNGHSCQTGVDAFGNSGFAGSGQFTASHWSFANINFIGSGYAATTSSYIAMNNTSIGVSNCTGPQYNVDANSHIRMSGWPFPGNLPGSVSNFSFVE